MSSCFNTIAGCYVYEGTLWYKSMGYVWSDYWTFEGFDNDCGCGVITRMTLPLMKETTIIALTKPTKDTMDQDIQSPATTSTCSIYDREPSPHVLLQFPIKKIFAKLLLALPHGTCCGSCPCCFVQCCLYRQHFRDCSRQSCHVMAVRNKEHLYG